ASDDALAVAVENLIQSNDKFDKEQVSQKIKKYRRHVKATDTSMDVAANWKAQEILQLIIKWDFSKSLLFDNNEAVPSSRPAPVPVAPTLAPLPPVPPRLPNVPVTRPSLPPPTQASTQRIPDATTSVKPVILNRFGDDGELMMGSPSSASVTPRPTTARPPITQNTQRPTTRPTYTYAGAGSDAVSTRFPQRPTTELPQPYSTAITFIDQIGYKIIRTTELVTDILKSTVKAVIGR
ncbi:hypothetical protein evm_009134, partial [Chilo suppressalis]